MSLRNVLLLVFALVAAGGTALFARGWMNSERAAMAAHQKPAPVEAKQFVLVAKANLPAGRFVKAEDFRWQGWPEGNLPPSYLVKGKRQPEDLAGAVMRSGMVAGEPVTDARIVKPGDRGFMAAVLQPGMRAVSVPVTAITGAAGFIFPGDRVDILVTHAVATEGGQRKSAIATETVLNDLRVVAIDQRTDDQDNKPNLAKTVTLEVTPKQVEIVRIVSRLGTLSLSLRSLAEEAPQGEAADLDADALVASLDQGDAAVQPNIAAPAKPELPPEGKFTVDYEVSRLLGGVGGQSQKVVVMRGAKSEEKSFRNGRLEMPQADADAPVNAELAGAAENLPEELLP